MLSRSFTISCSYRPKLRTRSIQHRVQQIRRRRRSCSFMYRHMARFLSTSFCRTAIMHSGSTGSSVCSMSVEQVRSSLEGSSFYTPLTRLYSVGTGTFRSTEGKDVECTPMNDGRVLQNMNCMRTQSLYRLSCAVCILIPTPTAHRLKRSHNAHGAFPQERCKMLQILTCQKHIATL